MPTESTAATWLGKPDPDAPLHPGDAPSLPLGLVDRGVLGVGGMGEVRLAHDQAFDRLVAVKLMSPSAAADSDLRRRFLAEARCMAALDHPAVVPVFDRGVLDDERPWYSMRRVRGRTLAEALTSDDAPLPVLVGHLRMVGQALAHAHSEGWVHRDVTPRNVLLGPFGEVLLLDWGIAGRQGAPSQRVMGTPRFMAPEQQQVGVPQTGAVDVFALGRVLSRVLAGSVRAPEELLDLVEDCGRVDPSRRPGVAEVVARLDDWTHGMRARARALAVRERGAPHRGAADAKAAEALRRRDEAERALASLPLGSPPSAKQGWWDQLDAAEALLVEAEDQRARWVRTLHAALEVAPDLREAHVDLADHHRWRCDEAEAAGDPVALARHRRLLAAHDDGRHAAYLRGRRAVVVDTVPSVEAALRPLVVQRRQLVPGDPVWSGHTGPVGLDVPARRLLVVAHTAAGRTLRWPVDARRPVPHAGPLTLPDDLRDDEVWVPGGWFVSGGDPLAIDGLSRRRLWVPPFVMARHPVTFGDYLAFLDALWAWGRHDEALARAPGIDAGGEVQAIVVRHADGFVVQPRPDGVARRRDEPVTMVRWHDAVAYAAWRAERDGRAWRLPHDQEWEKAARGVDGRCFPWGDHFEAAWCRCVRSRSTPRCATVDEHPDDVSVYGVRGLAGNARTWCRNAFDKQGPDDGATVDPLDDRGDPAYRAARGGAWVSEPDLCRAAARFAGRPDRRYTAVGVHLVRSLSPGA